MAFFYLIGIFFGLILPPNKHVFWVWSMGPWHMHDQKTKINLKLENENENEKKKRKKKGTSEQLRT